MSDDYLPLLLAHMQQEIVNLRNRLDLVEQAIADQVDEAGDGEQPETYLDGTPVDTWANGYR